MAEQITELVRVHLHPTPAQQPQPRRALQQLGALVVREHIAVVAENQAHIEVEQLARPHADRRLGADHRGDPRPARVAPEVRDADDHARLFERRHLAKEPIGAGRIPRERVEDLARLDQLAHELAPLGRAPHRLEQGHQQIAIASLRGAPSPPWPSGVCWSFPALDTRVEYVARNANGRSGSRLFSARCRHTRPTA